MSADDSTSRAPSSTATAAPTEWRPTDTQIDAAVGWWCSALGRPKYDGLGPRANSDLTSPEYWKEKESRRNYEVGEMMMAAYGAKLTDEQIAKFAEHLRDVLAGRCSHTWLSSYGEYAFKPPHYLSVDYHPDVSLLHCGEIAEFPKSFFWPIKTSMWIDRETASVRVRYGYGAEIKEINGYLG
jgi:hypothetical protein